MLGDSRNEAGSNLLVKDLAYGEQRMTNNCLMLDRGPGHVQGDKTRLAYPYAVVASPVGDCPTRTLPLMVPCHAP